ILDKLGLQRTTTFPSNPVFKVLLQPLHPAFTKSGVVPEIANPTLMQSSTGMPPTVPFYSPCFCDGRVFHFSDGHCPFYGR
ncbi:hypothetical protein, partial [uncultured Akkermansia sp.]|uniref:hypothetical protein n=1 Tax=uncultured Akkermansia sp. TaxID=512294 RepID=UPI00265CB09F